MSATCQDCGRPVHPAGVTCAGTPVLYHDSAADTMACPGTGIHVKAAFTGASGTGLMDTSPEADAISTLLRARDRLLAMPGNQDRSDEGDEAA